MSSHTTPTAGGDRAPCADGMSVEGSPWDTRYERAAELYERLAFSPDLLEALAAGLQEWASTLPQAEQTASGRHKPVNSWGLGPEFHKLRDVEIQLDLDGDRRRADRLRELAQDLLATAGELDGCYPIEAHDDAAAARRLVRTARVQAGVLRRFLQGLKRRCFAPRVGSVDSGGPARSRPPNRARRPPPIAIPGRKRASRAAAIEALRHELIEHIRAAADHLRAGRDGARPTLAAYRLLTRFARETSENRQGEARLFRM